MRGGLVAALPERWARPAPWPETAGVPRDGSGQATMTDVARAAGVSLATVSKVCNGRPMTVDLVG